MPYTNSFKYVSLLTSSSIESAKIRVECLARTQKINDAHVTGVVRPSIIYIVQKKARGGSKRERERERKLNTNDNSRRVQGEGEILRGIREPDALIDTSKKKLRLFYARKESE